jgi:hypothetical protein
MERPVSSHRPQHERQTLAPRCRSQPPHAFQRRQATLPPRWYSWSRRQDYTARPRPTQQRRVRDSSYKREPAQAPSSPRSGAQVQRRQEEEVPTSAARQAAPAHQVPPCIRPTPTENQRKRER